MVRDYIDDVLVVNKYNFTENLKELEEFLQKICRSGIKSKYRKFILRTYENQVPRILG